MVQSRGKGFKNRAGWHNGAVQKKKKEKKKMRVFTGRVKREEDEGRRGNGPGERGDRDLKEC